MNLIDVTAEFNTDDKCLDYLERLRWPSGVCCIKCGSVRVSRITRETKSKNKRTRLYQCLEPECKHQFSPTAGTIFHDSHLPLKKWFAAIALVCEAKKGLSALQMQRHLKVNYRTAWHLCHRIREAMKEPRSMFSGTVEVDETYIGGHLDKRRKQPGLKFPVVGLVERGGKVQALKVPMSSAPILIGVVKRRVEPGSRVITDQLRAYTALRKDYDHDVINHIKEFARGDIHTNTIENFWSLLNRGIVGSYHKVSIKHLDRYLAEFTYRFNRRDMQEQLFAGTTKNLLNGKVLTYQKLTDSGISGS
ncbi:MAG TPA: IS1595 family transposase [Candidatus Acidoferrales bacterium]|jgi:transposase-like protein|nr:IS1595 family transposase [Candidatus Acidoferrales bacterium]